MKIDDVILHLVTRVTTFIIMTFSIYLFLAGHHNPGGGFIGGLVTASAIILLYLAYDLESINTAIPIDFKKLAAIGVLIALLTGLSGVVFGDPFLNQTFDYFDLPFFGQTELATATLFDIGVYFAVVGTAITIVLSISEDV